LGKFKFGSRKAIEGFAEALAQKIWHALGDEIAADPAGWLICAPAYRFVPVSAVLLSRRVHELLVDRCAAAASKAPALVELYRETITGVDYASLSPKAREKALPKHRAPFAHVQHEARQRVRHPRLLVYHRRAGIDHLRGDGGTHGTFPLGASLRCTGQFAKHQFGALPNEEMHAHDLPHKHLGQLRL
jgi:hypothetical protein